MPVDINKWKETSLDAYLEVSLMKELGEESREGAERCWKCLFLRGSGGAVETDGHSRLHDGSWGQWFRRQCAKGWTRRISTHSSHWYSHLPMALHLCPPLPLLLGARGGNFRLDC